MARLESAERARLPDSAFAYVDARGNRRLPINDAAHVRNALARFDQVVFGDEKSRDRARKRLLNAARKFGIVPVGFISGQLHSERELGRLHAQEPVQLPSGFVTMLLTDIEGSTALVQRLGDRYGTCSTMFARSSGTRPWHVEATLSKHGPTSSSPSSSRRQPPSKPQCRSNGCSAQGGGSTIWKSGFE